MSKINPNKRFFKNGRALRDSDGAAAARLGSRFAHSRFFYKIFKLLKKFKVQKKAWFIGRFRKAARSGCAKEVFWILVSSKFIYLLILILISLKKAIIIFTIKTFAK